MKTAGTLPITTLVAWLLLTTTAGAVELIPNGHFDQDLSGWILPDVPDTTVSWDPDGLPGGSLRIDSTYVVPIAAAIDAMGPCVLMQSGFSYTLSGHARAAVGSGGPCNIDAVLYSEVGCAGETAATFLGTQGQGSWEYIEGSISTGLSFRLVLRMHRYATPSATCWFDNVSLIGPDPSPLEIPTLGRGALAILSLALVLLAFAALRRRAG